MTSDASPQPASSSTPTQLEFTRLGNVRVQAVFDEPELSSDGGDSIRALLGCEPEIGLGLLSAELDKAGIDEQLILFLDARIRDAIEGTED